MNGTDIKYFTRVEAEKTLPLVRQIVRDILNNAYAVRYISNSLGEMATDNPVINELIGKIGSYLEELEEIGCKYRDWNFQVGLVDFPSIIDGEEVVLCWRSDEESIRYFHKLELGFMGRELIPESYL